MNPVGGGDGLAGQWRGYQELCRARVIQHPPVWIGVQPRGAAPLVNSFQQEHDRVSPIGEARTVASGLRVTFSGDHALRAIRSSGGTAVAVEDVHILEFQERLARLEGVWVESSGAISVAALPQLLEAGLICPGEKVVCVLTGAGFKDHCQAGVGAIGDANIPTTDFELDEVEEETWVLLHCGTREKGEG